MLAVTVMRETEGNAIEIDRCLRRANERLARLCPSSVKVHLHVVSHDRHSLASAVPNSLATIRIEAICQSW